MLARSLACRGGGGGTVSDIWTVRLVSLEGPKVSRCAVEVARCRQLSKDLLCMDWTRTLSVKKKTAAAASWLADCGGVGKPIAFDLKAFCPLAPVLPFGGYRDLAASFGVRRGGGWKRRLAGIEGPHVAVAESAKRRGLQSNHIFFFGTLVVDTLICSSTVSARKRARLWSRWFLSSHSIRRKVFFAISTSTCRRPPAASSLD